MFFKFQYVLQQNPIPIWIASEFYAKKAHDVKSPAETILYCCNESNSDCRD